MTDFGGDFRLMLTNLHNLRVPQTFVLYRSVPQSWRDRVRPHPSGQGLEGISSRKSWENGNEASLPPVWLKQLKAIGASWMEWGGAADLLLSMLAVVSATCVWGFWEQAYSIGRGPSFWMFSTTNQPHRHELVCASYNSTERAAIAWDISENW